MNWHVIKTIARKEFIVNVKNYWVLSVAILIFILNGSIIRLDISFAGFEAQMDPSAILLSLIHLQMYVMPLFALIISYDGMLKERELGTLDLLLSYPLRSSDMVVGKWLGFSAVLSLSFLLGFLFPAYILMQLGIAYTTIVAFILLSLCLGLIFTSFGLFLSAFSRERTFVIAMCIIVWVFFVFLFDLGFVALVIATNGIVTSSMINWILFLNPADVFRIVSILSFLSSDVSEIYGLGTGILTISYGTLAMLLWLFLPLLFTMKKNFVSGRGVRYEYHKKKSD